MKAFSMKIFLIAILWILQVMMLHAQNWQWSHHLGSDREERVKGVTDKYGNFYMAGDFDGYYFYSANQTLTRRGGAGLFLAKYDPQGNEEWIRQFDTYSSSNIPEHDGHIWNIITGEDGFVYLTGWFKEKKNFGSCTLNSHGGDMFLVKFAPDGSCRWAKSAYGAQDVNGNSMATDSLNNVYIFGANKSAAFFDTISVEAGGFLAKYDSTGEVLWARNIIPVSTLYSDKPPQVVFSGMTVSGGKLFAIGREYAYSITVDTATRNHPGMMGNALCCFDLDGNIQWLREGISIVTEGGNNLSADRQGNIYICGYFFESIDFNGTILNTEQYKSDYFVCKYGHNGDLVWADQCSASDDAKSYSVFSDSTGHIYLTGSFSGTARFGSDTVTSDSLLDMFLARYDPGGQCLGVVHFGNAEGQSVGQDVNGNPVVVGTFSKNIMIGQNTYNNFQTTPYTMDDIFIAKCGHIPGSVEPRYPEENQLLIYANPNEGKCTVTIPEEFLHEKQLTLQVFDFQGKLIEKTVLTLADGKIRLNLEAQSKGMYQVVVDNGRKRYTGKVVFE